MRTGTLLKRLSVLCAGVTLFACADLSERFTLPSQAAAARADEAYLLGRNQYLARHYEDAIKAYRAALKANPAHVNARNGLATLYAERRDFVHAIEIWRELTERAALRPGSAYLFSNLGYAYFLNGDYEKSRVALEKACVLDPLNQNAWQHLGETMEKLGQNERAAQMLRQASALREHDFRVDYAASASGARVPPIDNAVKAASRADLDWAANEVHVRPDGLLELRRVPAQQPLAAALPLAPTPAPTSTPAAAPAAARAVPAVAILEIRNGNGVTGMARALSRQMGDPGFKVARLTNDKGFKVHATRVEYQDGFRAAAERLAARFDNAALVQVKNCKPSDLRLVIGRDLVRAKFVLRPLAQPERELAVAAAPGKAG